MNKIVSIQKTFVSNAFRYFKGSETRKLDADDCQARYEDWYFEPIEYEGNTLFSRGYSTFEKAVLAAVGSGGGAKGGSATTAAKRESSAANGAKGGRPPKPNLYIKFQRAVLQTTDSYESDLLLKNLVFETNGNTSWFPTDGPSLYVRLHLKNGISARLQKMLSNSQLIWEWDDKELEIHQDTYFCTSCAPTSEDPRNRKLLEQAPPLIWTCTTCQSNPALYRLDDCSDDGEN
ncbi:MAG TPA: hypothetical protein V6C97_21140 [Oculatellaceae cyanobacterium]